jgi:hypothetical protein
MRAEAQHPRSPVERRNRPTIWPTTVAGWWAVGLAVAFFAFVAVATVVPRGAALGFACGLTGAALALTAIIRDRERAVMVLAALVPLIIAGAFALTQLITGNP